MIAPAARALQESATWRRHTNISEALEDTEYLFVCEGPVLFYDKDGLTNYLGWEDLVRLREAAKSGEAPSLKVSAAG